MSSDVKTIRNNQLTPETYVIVRGNIEFSRLTRPFDGEELEKDKRRRMSTGGIPIDKPYTTVTIGNARILPLKPGQKSIEETYVEERFYSKANDPDKIQHYSVTNKSPYPNRFYQADPGKILEGEQIYPERELANGLDVVLVLRIFAANGFAQRGIGLYSIILQEPLRYYMNDQTKALEAAGIHLRNQPNPNEETPAITDAPVEPATVPAPQENAFATPAPAVPEVAAAPVVEDANGPWICPQCGTEVPAGQNFCGTCGSRKAAATPNPYQAAAGGIRVNTQSRNY